MNKLKIPEGWKQAKLGEIAKISAGGTPSTKHPEYWGGGIPWMNSGDLNMRRIKSVNGRITELGLNSSSAKLVPPYSVLIGLAGQGKTRGTVATNEIELTTNQSVAFFIPQKINYKYLFFDLYRRYFELRSISAGDGGRGGLNLKILNNLKILLPTQIEQARIVSILQTWDKALEKLNRKIGLKKNIKKGLLQKLMSAKTRLPGFNGEWKTVKMTDICDVRDGTHASPKYHDNGIKLLTSKNIKNGIIDWSDVSLISEGDSININKRSKVDKGDIIMSMIGTIGNSVLVISNPDFCIKNVALFKPKKNINNEYLIQYFHSSLYIKLLKQKLDGGIQKFVSLGGLRKLSIKIPSIKEQTAIAQILTTADDEISALEKKRDLWEAQKKYLLNNLVTGKIRTPENLSL